MKQQLPSFSASFETSMAAISNDIQKLKSDIKAAKQKRRENIIIALAGALTIGAIVVLVYALLSIQ